MTAADWKRLYPFEGRSIDVAGQRIHVLDEGAGPPVVMLHGNPTWSFHYRELVKELRSDHRCIVPDHVGCGLSDKPSAADYPYSLERRVSDLEALLDALDVSGDVTLVVHDWGGMIGMAWATRHPDRVARIVVLNTAAFRLPEGKPLPWQLRVVRNTPLGPLLVRGLNAFSRGTVKDCVTRKPLDEATRQGYLAPYDSWGNRAAVYHFVKTIPLGPADAGYDIVLATEEGLPTLHGKPMLVCWGMQDFVFDGDFLAGWERRFPDAEVHRFEDAGHLVLEDARDEILALVRAFIARHPLGVEA